MTEIEQRMADQESTLASHEERIKTLFHLSGEANESLKKAAESMSSMATALAQTNQQLAVLTTQVAGLKSCPNPSGCLTFEPRLRVLEDAHAANQGRSVERVAIWKIVTGGLLLVFGAVGAFATCIKLLGPFIATHLNK